jgi:hypothetical protein
MWPRSVFTPERFEADILDIADDADGRDHAVDGDVWSCPCPLERRGDVVAPFLSSFVTLGRRS